MMPFGDLEPFASGAPVTQTVRRRHLWVLATGVSLFAGALSGCSSDAPDPAQQRRERVETRLGESFSKDQADCIVKAIDEPTLRALDGTGDLVPDSKPMLTYTVAVRTCVGSPTVATTTTTVDGASTTTG